MRAELKRRDSAAARKVPLALVLAACLVAAGCGDRAATKEPSFAARRDVAQRFAVAIFRGKADAAVALLVHPDDSALSWLVTHAAAPWKNHHAAVRLAGKRSGGGWVFGYAGMHPRRDGVFEKVRGDLVVVVAASPKGAGVEFFTFRNEEIQVRTHHDSLLLPSNR